MKCHQCKKDFKEDDLYSYLIKDNPYNIQTQNKEWKKFRKMNSKKLCIECIRNNAKTTWEKPEKYADF